MIFVVGNHQDRLLIFGRHGLQERNDFLAVFAVQIPRRFIRHDQGRTGDKRPANRRPLLLPAGKLTGQVLPALCQSQHMQQLLHKSLVRDSVVQEKRKNHILLHIQFGNQVEGLKDKTNVLPPEHGQLLLGQGKHILPVDPDAARCGIVQRAHNIQQRAFAGAGFSNDGNKFPPADGERNLIQRMNRRFACSINFTQILYFKNIHGKYLLWSHHTPSGLLSGDIHLTHW